SWAAPIVVRWPGRQAGRVRVGRAVACCDEGEGLMGGVHVARAELTLARESSEPLRRLTLKPDPLVSFARVLGGVRDDLGERAEVIVDLMPVTPSQRRRRLRAAVAKERRSARGGAGPAWLAELREAVLEDGVGSHKSFR